MTLRSRLRDADLWAVAAALALIVAAAVVGRRLLATGHRLVLPQPPLVAYWSPHLGWGTPLVLLCVLLGVRLHAVAATLPWRRLLVAGWLLNLAWMGSLTLIDGLRRGWIDVLLNPNEYLQDLPRVGSPAAFLRGFVHNIAFAPDVGDDLVWTTHVAGHPPLATLTFWWLDRAGLGGGFWAGALCILIGSAAAVAVPVVVRELGHGGPNSSSALRQAQGADRFAHGADQLARRAVPFAALFPGAVWMAVSADGLFAGVATSGLALLVAGAVRRRIAPAILGGLLLGAALYMSYGLAVFGVVVLAGAGVIARRQGWRRLVAPGIAASAGVAAVAAVHTAFGFNWFAGLAALRVRYYQGIAADRPYGYFVWADVAAWLVACSPFLLVGLRRAFTLVRAQNPVAVLGLAGVAAALLADLSGLSKAETERIWLTFGAIAWSTMALVPGRRSRWLLITSAGWAIAINHLYLTGW